MFRNILFNQIDNSQIVLFRIFFGLLMIVECWGAILTGWVKETFVDPQFTFTFIGFEWTQFLVGPTMYYVFIFLGFMGLMIMLGAFYRLSSFLFAAGWSLVYFMQKEHYNNHYYFVMLVAWMMVFIPANRYKSVDIWLWPKLRSNFTYYWTRLIFILQLFILYTFAAWVKLYPGWMNGDFLMVRYRNTANWVAKTIEWQPLTDFVYSRNFARIFAYLGFGFDLLIVPLLLWRRTRIPALIAAFIFHLFNSITLHIGIFPYFALALSIFFFPPETIRDLFFPRKSTFLPQPTDSISSPGKKSFFTFVFILYFLWQLYLPLRHYFIPGNVLWTDEGHRMAWRMMLRSKAGYTNFTIEDKKTGAKTPVNKHKYLTPLQISRLAGQPDMIWQFAQYLKKEEAKEGRDVGVYAHSIVSINGGPDYEFVDKNVDLADVKWKYFGHQDWIMPEPEEYKEINNFRDLFKVPVRE